MFQTFRKELTWGGRRLILETGKVARQADGAVMATYGETTVLDKTPSKSKTDRGVVYVETIGYNQDGTIVCIFRRKVMVPTREYIDARGGEQPGRPDPTPR